MPRQSTRHDLLLNSQHPSSRLHGLRMINNNYVPDPTGRDWMISGDPGYHSGRMTPNLGRDHVPGPPIRQKGIDGRRPCPPKSRVRNGAMHPVPAVLQRWQRSQSMPCAIDKLAHRAVGLGQDAVSYTMPATSKGEMEKLDTQFKPTMSAHPCRAGTLPVDRYHYFSEMSIVDTRRPQGSSEVEPAVSSYTHDCRHQRLEEPTLHTHHFFSEPHLQVSPHVQYMQPADGISGPRSTLNQNKMSSSLAGLQPLQLPGLMSASMAALPPRLSAGIVFGG